jgi:hypothetical protein
MPLQLGVVCVSFVPSQAAWTNAAIAVTRARQQSPDAYTVPDQRARRVTAKACPESIRCVARRRPSVAHGPNTRSTDDYPRSPWPLAAGSEPEGELRHSRPRPENSIASRAAACVQSNRVSASASRSRSLQSLCGAPHNRQLTNGFRSEWGAQAYAALCSIVETGRLNHPQCPCCTCGSCRPACDQRVMRGE